MGFQIKDFVSIAASMVNYAKATQDQLTDFNVGSVARTLMESPAIEMEELYQRIFMGLLDAIPTATYLTFGFEKLPARSALGYVVVTAASPLAETLPIPAGTEFVATDGRTYLATDDAEWLAGERSIRMLVRATASGAAGNIGFGKIISSKLFTDPQIAVSNDLISTGRDKETDEDRAARFADFVKSISRGTTSAIRYAASQVVVGDEYVVRSSVVSGGGRVQVFIYTSKGMPSTALLAQVQRVIDGYVDTSTGVIHEGYVAAGVRADALPMVERSVSMDAYVEMLPNNELTDEKANELRDAYSAFVGSVESGKTLLIDELRDQMLAVPGVKRIVLATDSNIPCGVQEVLLAGALGVSPIAGVSA